jgi:hypothetical protein
MVFDEDCNSATAIETPFFFVVVEYGECGRIDSREQETLYPGLTIGNDVRVAVLRGYPFEPEQFSFAPREMASRERGEGFLIHQGAVDE